MTHAAQSLCCWKSIQSHSCGDAKALPARVGSCSNMSMTAPINLVQGSLMYRDQRLSGFDAAAVIEVIEHLDTPRLSAFERVLFEFAHPSYAVITTPNSEYNSVFETLPAGQFRHRDHRFEWTRAEFEQWARAVAVRYGYDVRFQPIGPEDAERGAPTQMGIFTRG